MESLNMEHQLKCYVMHLKNEEKSRNTVEKYERDVKHFLRWMEREGKVMEKQQIIRYKEQLQKDYAVSSCNSMLVAVNGFLKFTGNGDCCVRLLKTQHRIYQNEERQLTRAEYSRLLKATESRKERRLQLIMETIGTTGIRVSELEFITAEAVRSGVAVIYLKGKSRSVYLPAKLVRKLQQFMRTEAIRTGALFRGRNGQPLHRGTIWHQMKQLCKAAGVAEAKVFPHNLRHLFARLFYEAEHDIIALADILGHVSTETTRIYTRTTLNEQARKIERLHLLL